MEPEKDPQQKEPSSGACASGFNPHEGVVNISHKAAKKAQKKKQKRKGEKEGDPKPPVHRDSYGFTIRQGDNVRYSDDTVLQSLKVVALL